MRQADSRDWIRTLIVNVDGDQGQGLNTEQVEQNEGFLVKFLSPLYKLKLKHLEVCS